jgi:hypothetical protein
MPEVKTNDGCIIHVEIEGPQNAPVLMLSNSLGTNLHMWTIICLLPAGASRSLHQPGKLPTSRL